MSKKVLVYLLIVAGITAAFLVIPRLLTANPYASLPDMDITQVNDGEAAWYLAGILDYEIQVEVSFSNERRLQIVTVAGGQVVDAQLANWDAGGEAWGAFQSMSDEEAAFFTVPGLFNTIRRDLQNEEVQREFIRAELGGEPFMPRVIYLGRVFQETAYIDGTDVVIEVVRFMPHGQ